MQKILAIDDKQDNLISIRALLKNFLLDTVVFTAQSGQEGLKIAQRPSKFQRNRVGTVDNIKCIKNIPGLVLGNGIFFGFLLLIKDYVALII